MKYRNEFIIVALILLNLQISSSLNPKERTSKRLLRKIKKEKRSKDFLEEETDSERYEHQRILQPIDKAPLNATDSLYCHQFKDCYNCSAFSSDKEDCKWASGKCTKEENPEQINNWWNYFNSCLVDMSSILKSQKYCGSMPNNSSFPIEISLPMVHGKFGAKNIYCKWSLDLEKNDEEADFILNYSDHIQDYESILIAQVTYRNKKILSKTFTNRVDWVLQDVVTLDIHYYTLKYFDKNPFTLKIISQEITVNNNVVVFVTIGVLILLCIILTYIILKCSRRYKSIRNLNSLANRDQNNAGNNNNNLANSGANNNLNPSNFNNEEVNFINANDALNKNNLEILNKLMSSKIQGTKYTEKMNVFEVNCTICLEHFVPDDLVIKLFCKHIFHFECLKDLMVKNRHNAELKCPNCKNEVLFHTLEDKTKNNTANVLGENRSPNNNNDNNESKINTNKEIGVNHHLNANSIESNNNDNKNAEKCVGNKANRKLQEVLNSLGIRENLAVAANRENQIELNGAGAVELQNQAYTGAFSRRDDEDAVLESEQREIIPKKGDLGEISFKNSFKINSNPEEKTLINNNSSKIQLKNVLNLSPKHKSLDRKKKFFPAQSDINIGLNINRERNVFNSLNEDENKQTRNAIEDGTFNIVNKNHINFNCTMCYKNAQIDPANNKNNNNRKDYVELERNEYKNTLSREDLNPSDDEENKTV